MSCPPPFTPTGHYDYYDTYARARFAHALISDDYAIESHDGTVVKYEGKVNRGESAMNPSEKIYGIHWETEQEYPLWQLTSLGYLRLDVTRMFDAKFRLVAYRHLEEETANALRARMVNGLSGIDAHYWKCEIESVKVGGTGSRGGRCGFTRDIFKFILPPEKDDLWWRVTNCARLTPGLMHTWARESDYSNKWLVNHPSDPYQVQFSGVPWLTFKKYWRKPINLNRKWHDKRTNYDKRFGMPTFSAPAIEVLNFDLNILKSHKCFFADFSHMYLTDKKRVNDSELAKWMLANARAFRLLSDEDSPFVKPEAEFLFSVDWM